MTSSRKRRHPEDPTHTISLGLPVAAARPAQFRNTLLNPHAFARTYFGLAAKLLVIFYAEALSRPVAELVGPAAAAAPPASASDTAAPALAGAPAPTLALLRRLFAAFRQRSTSTHPLDRKYARLAQLGIAPAVPPVLANMRAQQAASAAGGTSVGTGANDGIHRSCFVGGVGGCSCANVDTARGHVRVVRACV